MKKVFIGVDFSKLTIDVAILIGSNATEVLHSQFENTEQGCKRLLKWLQSETKEQERSWLFCGEHTGIYVVPLVSFLQTKGIDIWLDSALRINRSRGLCRGKDDKSDAKDIALYAYRYQDRAKVYQSPTITVEGLKDLMAYRERLKSIRHSLYVSSKELKRIKTSDLSTDYIYTKSQEQIDKIDESINEVEKKILSLIKEDEQVKHNYDIITSIKGISLVNAVTIIVATNNFSWFCDARQFSCYSGSAPFKHQSGTSVKVRDKISPLANKKIKVFLTLAATSAMRHNEVYKVYYQRKKAEGKEHFLIINNMRNKLIHLIFSLIKSGKKYDENYINQLAKTA